MSKRFFQEIIDEAIELLEESRTKSLPIDIQRIAFDLIEKLSGLLAGIKGKEEQEFAKLVRYTNEFLQYLRDYEIVQDKSAVAVKMELLAKAIAVQAQKIASLSSPKELEKLTLKHRFGSILGSLKLLERDDFSEKKVRSIILEHELLEWKKKEAQEFSLMVNYIDNYLKCLLDAKAAIRKDVEAAIEHLRKAKIFGVLIVKQAKKLAELL